MSEKISRTIPDMSLEEAAEYEGTEVGELWALLARMAYYYDYMPKYLEEAVKTAIREEERNLAENYELIEVERVHVKKDRFLESIV